MAPYIKIQNLIQNQENAYTNALKVVRGLQVQITTNQISKR